MIVTLHGLECYRSATLHNRIADKLCRATGHLDAGTSASSMMRAFSLSRGNAQITAKWQLK
jgi:hypothetical protein